MTALNKANGNGTQAASAVVLFGLSDDGKPQAGVFPEGQAALAKKVAKALRLNTLCVTASQLAAIGTRIPAGRLYANRRSFIPNVRRDVHQKLIEFAKSGGGTAGRGTKPSNPPLPPSAAFPKDWDSIGPGHQVIAHATQDEGWWEAIVIAREGDMLTLRWRDDGRYPSWTVHYGDVALQRLQVSP